MKRPVFSKAARKALSRFSLGSGSGQISLLLDDPQGGKIVATHPLSLGRVKLLALLRAALLSLSLCASRAEDLTLALTAPDINVTGVRLVRESRPLGGSTPARVTNILTLATRSFTYTNLTFGTNVITLVWSNAQETRASKPLTFVSLPETGSVATPPAPGANKNKKKIPVPPQPMVAVVSVNDD